MTELSIMIEGQDGVNWAIWKPLVEEVEALGFPGLFRSDHYTNAGPPEKDSLEMVVSLAYLAGNTQRIHFGPMVAPFSFREPTMLARQALAIDDLSGARMLLGLGAGWQEREHSMFGHHLGSMKERMDRFEEGVEVVSRLLNSDEPVSFEGRYFQLREAILLPRPQRPGGPRILIGGSGRKRTLPLVARHAHQWNTVNPPVEEFRELSAHLDDLLRQEGRQPGDVKRSLMTMVMSGYSCNLPCAASRMNVCARRGVPPQPGERSLLPDFRAGTRRAAPLEHPSPGADVHAARRAG